MKVVIADDEPLARERLRALLAEHPGVEVLAEAGNGLEALRACADLHPDLVLLDIAMPGIDGLETARHLASFEPRPAVVFCTAYDAHALSAFEAAAIDYLMKPVRAERLAAALERARTFMAGRSSATALPSQQSRSHLCARLRGSLRLIPVDDIHYLQAEEKYVVVHHARGEDLIEESLKSLEEEFAERFVRIHRNCLVARHELVELRRLGEGQVHAVLRHAKQPLEVSRRCVAQLRQEIRHR
ncbi:LytR/AlgR family response regulator transcription factor [Xanthomonas translucens]|uniref:LytR/AlgR family response regulator transcription factor n=1 Tax=Xanthomonas campestris pv. translucens TaxID=343 RepID=UPI00071E8DC6|nr:LytTR family DNA-binding domain-containing protein [Xanthomonas translucens]KTF36831.1 chemotaxis protein CheY [Xanthomonas translucens pv. translucens]KWV14489.1 two-component system response regulator [Xanthomonas translucens]MCS3360019.1 LytTR family DNA-binding domain-containing protein [Xanthomonas translucens pv. translucens]MCS3374008.1 LytTR family DNA-binding domain-containing protein [Xanthomonas translucens pv. translucens]MCT8274806.1 LytTR family DNA-binding domain-containing p